MCESIAQAQPGGHCAPRAAAPATAPDVRDLLDAPPADAPDPRATWLRLQLAELRRKKLSYIRGLARLDIEEERLAEVFERNFPGEPFRPAVPWIALTYKERMTAHFVCRRGVVKRLRDVTLIYAKVTGEVITPDAFAMRISRLHLKGVLVRRGDGWRIAQEYAEDARKQPTPPGRPTGPDAVRLAAKRVRQRQFHEGRRGMVMRWRHVEGEEESCR